MKNNFFKFAFAVMVALTVAASSTSLTKPADGPGAGGGYQGVSQLDGPGAGGGYQQVCDSEGPEQEAATIHGMTDLELVADTPVSFSTIRNLSERGDCSAFLCAH